ncbi:MAG: helix-turn-helix domain-containing protein [Acidobacteria bacterium]|nr:helix-turn-helix domain-containing protein [Acidobacteriota bacterium]
MTPHLLTLRQTADLLGVRDEETVRTWTRVSVRHGGLPFVQIGRCIRIDPRDLDRWIAQRKRSGRPS